VLHPINLAADMAALELPIVFVSKPLELNTGISYKLRLGPHAWRMGKQNIFRISFKFLRRDYRGLAIS
jgi:hypothetical protein